jgi:hypothetical protein
MAIDLNSKSQLGDRVNALIDDSIFLEHAWDAPREYLGISVVGHTCDRHVQYQYLVTRKEIPEVPIEPRTRRIFDRGHTYEAKARQWLMDCGFVFYPDPAEISDFDGRFKGHVDGVIVGYTGAACPIPLPALWENKTLGAKGWKKLEKEGLKEFSSTYWSQVHSYMGYFGLLKCLFTAVNADTMELQHFLIDFESAEFEMVKVKAARVFQAVDLGELLPRCTQDPAYYVCSYCPFRKTCWA